MSSKSSPSLDQPAARVALKAPRPDSLVEVRLTPPDSNFEVKVSPDGETIELIIHPGAGLITVRLSPPAGGRTETRPASADTRTEAPVQSDRDEADEVAPGISRAEANALMEEEESIEAGKLLAAMEENRSPFPGMKEAVETYALPEHIREILETEAGAPAPDEIELMGDFPPPEEALEPGAAEASAPAEPEAAGAVSAEEPFAEAGQAAAPSTAPTALPESVREILEAEAEAPAPDEIELMGDFPPPEESLEPEAAGGAVPEEPEAAGDILAEEPSEIPQADDGRGLSPEAAPEEPTDEPYEITADYQGGLSPYDPDFDVPPEEFSVFFEIEGRDPDMAARAPLEGAPEGDIGEKAITEEAGAELFPGSRPGDRLPEFDKALEPDEPSGPVKPADSDYSGESIGRPPAAAEPAPAGAESAPELLAETADGDFSPKKLPQTEEGLILKYGTRPTTAAPAEEEPEYLEEIVVADLVPDTELIEVENGNGAEQAPAEDFGISAAGSRPPRVDAPADFQENPEEPLVLELAGIGRSSPPPPEGRSGAEDEKERPAAALTVDELEDKGQ